MKILHYSLGFSPYRTGGLTKFCMDLMNQQCMDGHQTALLWPGQMKFFHHKVSIKDRGTVLGDKQNRGVQSFEIINPLPVPYDEGISEFGAFEKNDGLEAYERLLEIYQPNVIHLHTLMGIHRSFLEAAQKRGIRLVFSVHDFFPVCPKVTMIRNGQVCSSAQSCSECGTCNATALSLYKIKLLQSPLYRVLKDTAIVRKLRTHHRGRYLSGALEKEKKDTPAAGTAADYRKLRAYYASLLKFMDKIHYNSSVAKSVYEAFFQLSDSVTINISHESIMDHKKKKEFIPGRLRMTYLGQQTVAKGFFLLQAALDKLWKTDNTFMLNIYFTPEKVSPYMKIHNKYSYSDLETILDNTDILIVPSIWKETFGYIVLEALSYGVPVLISGNVGAKDILAAGAGIVIENISVDSLYNSLKKITSAQLSEMNRTIIENQEILTLRCMSKMIEEKCYRERHV